MICVSVSQCHDVCTCCIFTSLFVMPSLSKFCCARCVCKICNSVQYKNLQELFISFWPVAKWARLMVAVWPRDAAGFLWSSS